MPGRLLKKDDAGVVFDTTATQSVALGQDTDVISGFVESIVTGADTDVPFQVATCPLYGSPRTHWVVDEHEIVSKFRFGAETGVTVPATGFVQATSPLAPSNMHHVAVAHEIAFAFATAFSTAVDPDAATCVMALGVASHSVPPESTAQVITPVHEMDADPKALGLRATVFHVPSTSDKRFPCRSMAPQNVLVGHEIDASDPALSIA